MSIVFRMDKSIFLLAGNTASTLIGEIQMAVKEKITVKEGLESIHTAFASFMDGTLTREQADQVGYVVLNEIQLRDYLMGFASEKGIEYVGGFLESLLSDINTEYAHPLLTILATTYLEVGEREQAWLALEESGKLNSEYSLTHLIKRVYLSGSDFGFPTMRAELHPKVKETLDEMSDKVISPTE